MPWYTNFLAVHVRQITIGACRKVWKIDTTQIACSTNCLERWSIKGEYPTRKSCFGRRGKIRSNHACWEPVSISWPTSAFQLNPEYFGLCDDARHTATCRLVPVNLCRDEILIVDSGYIKCCRFNIKRVAENKLHVCSPGDFLQHTYMRS